MWYFLNANMKDKAVLVLHPLHETGEEIGKAFKTAGADVHIHGEIPDPNCTKLQMHASGRLDVIVICHNDSRLSSTRLTEYAQAYAPYLAETGGTIIFALLHEDCAIDEAAPEPNPIQKFAATLGRELGRYGVRVNMIARQMETPITVTADTKCQVRNHRGESPPPAPVGFADVAMFLASPLNTYISGVVVAADT